MELVIQKPYAEDYQKACYSADDGSPQGVGHITPGGNSDQTCQGCVQAHANIGLSIFQPGKDHADYRSDGRCNGGSYKNTA